MAPVFPSWATRAAITCSCRCLAPSIARPSLLLLTRATPLSPSLGHGQAARKEDLVTASIAREAVLSAVTAARERPSAAVRPGAQELLGARRCAAVPSWVMKTCGYFSPGSPLAGPSCSQDFSPCQTGFLNIGTESLWHSGLGPPCVDLSAEQHDQDPWTGRCTTTTLQALRADSTAPACGSTTLSPDRWRYVSRRPWTSCASGCLVTVDGGCAWPQVGVLQLGDGGIALRVRAQVVTVSQSLIG
jgi:hypothetical protein